MRGHERIQGIYCIENVTNGKKYIGQSCDIFTRWNNHRWCLNNNSHSNIHLQTAWNKYGEANFIFYTIEECCETDIDDMERYYISLYHTTDSDFGYNLDSGGNANKRHSAETIIKISESNKGKTCSAETREKISKNRIGKMCGKDHFMYGKQMPVEWIEKSKKSNYERRHKEGYIDPRSLKVICLNTGEIFESIRDAAKKYSNLGVVDSNISRCCKKGSSSHYCGMFPDGTEIQWSYYAQEKVYEYRPLIKPPSNNIKSVSQYSSDGELLSVFESAKDAERKTGISAKLISKVCRGERYYTHGFHFEFTNATQMNKE